jgi:hypothetical protein
VIIISTWNYQPHERGWATVHKPKAKLSTPLTAKEETVRTPTVVLGSVPQTPVDQGLREFSRFREVASGDSPRPAGILFSNQHVGVVSSPNGLCGFCGTVRRAG